MPVIKVIDDKAAPSINGVICYNHLLFNIEDENAIKHHVFERDRKIQIRQGDEFIDAEDYFEDELRSEQEVAEIEKVEEVEEEEVEEEQPEDMTLEEVFSGHWRTQVANAEKQLETIEEFEEALEYAYDNDISDAVISRVEDMKNDLL